MFASGLPLADLLGMFNDFECINRASLGARVRLLCIFAKTKERQNRTAAGQLRI